MSRLLTSSGPFLFPCTIEYSLICAAVLFVMWKHIDEEHEHYMEQKRRRKISRVCRVPSSSTESRIQSEGGRGGGEEYSNGGRVIPDVGGRRF